MKVLVDTSVWSQAFRRDSSSNPQISSKLSELIDDGRVAIIGPIKQELVSGIKNEKQFFQLSDMLDEFPNELIIDDDYIHAAALFNQCRKKGIQGGHIDFLICTVSLRLDYPIFTLDKDFKKYGQIIEIKTF